MPELDPVRQELIADGTEWLATLDDMIAKAEAFAAAAAAMQDRLNEITVAADDAAVTMDAAASAAEKLAGAGAQAASGLGDVRTSAAGAAAATGEAGDSFNYLARIAAYLSATFGLVVACEDTVLASNARLTAMNQGLAESFGNIRSQATQAALSDRVLASMNDSLAASFGEAVTMARLETEQVRLLAETEIIAAGATAALADATRGLAAVQGAEGAGTMAGMMNAIAAVTGGGGGGGGGGGATGWLATSIAWWRQWQAVIHWAVMGTMEILSTAIPALVAFGAAMVAMYPAADQLKDHFSNLIIAAGSLSGAVSSMPGPMSTLASTMGHLSLAVAPDVWMMLGSAISIVTAHTGAFAGIAQQASDVLGNFAAKIVTDLQGLAGKALQDFFANGVKFMIQWGQVLGNFGRTFLNVFHAMPGIGHVVLDVLDAISRVLATITGIPVVGTILAIIAAFSGLYRYANLVSRALQFMWVAFGGQALAGAISSFAMLTQQMGLMGAATWVARGAWTSLIGSMGLIVPIAAAAVAGFELWYLNSKNVTDATKNLIQQVESAPNSVESLSTGIVILSTAMETADQRTQSFARTVQQATAGTKMSAGAAAATKELSNDTSALSSALATQYNKLKQVEQGLQAVGITDNQVASNMAVLTIATAMQDSHVSNLNNAWDAYLQLLTGGMSTLANYVTALRNMTSVTATTGINNLSQSTATLNLTAGQFQQQLQTGAVKGASAWQNFTQVMTGSLGPMADYLRQAQAAGVITKGQLAQGIAAATAAMIPYTGTTGTAADMLLAFYRQSGDNVSSLAQVAKAEGSTTNATTQLNSIMTAAAIAMSNASQVAQNLSSVFNAQVTQALVAAALKASGFSTDVQNMMQAQETGTNVAGHSWQYWANQAAAAWNQAQTAATTGTSNILGQLSKIPDNTIKRVTIVFGTSGSAPAGLQGAVAGGGGHTNPGMAGGGLVHGPGTSTSDSVHAMLSAGEYVVNAAASSAYRPLLEAVNAMGARRLAGGGPVSPGLMPAVLHAQLSGGAGPVNLHHASRVNVNVGGRRLTTQVQRETAIYARRNSGSGLSLRARLGTPR